MPAQEHQEQAVYPGFSALHICGVHSLCGNQPALLWRPVRVLWGFWVCSHDLLDAISHLAGHHEAQQEELGLLA